jgi:hypothetical protein
MKMAFDLYRRTLAGAGYLTLDTFLDTVNADKFNGGLA